MNFFSFQSARFGFGFETTQLTLMGIYYIFGYITVLRLEVARVRCLRLISLS